MHCRGLLSIRAMTIEYAAADPIPDMEVAYAVGALACLRTGEIIGLEWQDFDLDRGVMRVRRQVVGREGWAGEGRR
jgi:integrase